MNAWSKLPNAKHIDWVLDSSKSNIDIWNQAYDQAYDQARIQAWKQAWKQARGQAYEPARYEAYEQASGVLLALIAYDDCDQYLSMPMFLIHRMSLIDIGHNHHMQLVLIIHHKPDSKPDH